MTTTSCSDSLAAPGQTHACLRSWSPEVPAGCGAVLAQRVTGLRAAQRALTLDCSR
ncbi:MAG: hypothetical protein V2B17_00465 [Chloroflexota bacterium]